MFIMEITFFTVLGPCECELVFQTRFSLSPILPDFGITVC